MMISSECLFSIRRNGMAFACTLFSSGFTDEETESHSKTGPFWAIACERRCGRHLDVCWSSHFHKHLLGESNQCKHRLSESHPDSTKRRASSYVSSFFSQMLAWIAGWVDAGWPHPGVYWGVSVQPMPLSCLNPPMASPPFRTSLWNLVGPLSCALDLTTSTLPSCEPPHSASRPPLSGPRS